jgi:hypothetical protein
VIAIAGKEVATDQAGLAVELLGYTENVLGLNLGRDT